MGLILRNETGLIIGSEYSGSGFELTYRSVEEGKTNKSVVFVNPEAETDYSFWHDGDFYKNDFTGSDFYIGEQVTGSGNGIDYTIQDLGLKNRTFVVAGEVLGSSMALGKETFRSIIGQTGSIYSENIPQTSIFYENVSFEDNADNPLQTKFKLETIEIK